MCEFKIIKKNDGSQILEDIVVISYSQNNELLFKDVLGMGEILDSALILSVNTLNQRCEIVENPLIKSFLQIIQDLNANKLKVSDLERFQKELEDLKKSLE